MPPKTPPPFKINPVADLAVTTAYLIVAGLTLFQLAQKPADLAAFVAAFFGTAVAIKLSNYVFFTAGRWFSASFLSGSPFNNPLKKSISAKKFADQGWQLTIHASMTLFEIYLLSDEEWFQRTPSVWEQTIVPLKMSLKLFYMIQLGIWVYTGFSCRFLEHKRKDYIVMMLHHVVTIMLVAGSWTYGSQRAGVLVLYVHDFSDIWIDSMKMANYAKLKDKAGWYLSEVIYGTGLVAWVYYRLYLFPFKIIYSVIFETKYDIRPCTLAVCAVHPYLFTWSLLIFLNVLHVYWFALLLRIGLRALRGGDTHTATELYEGGSDSD